MDEIIGKMLELQSENNDSVMLIGGDLNARNIDNEVENHKFLKKLLIGEFKGDNSDI